jgi:HD superfamily phosphohydrolase
MVPFSKSTNGNSAHEEFRMADGALLAGVSGPDERRSRELEDLRLVLGAIFKDKQTVNGIAEGYSKTGHLHFAGESVDVQLRELFPVRITTGARAHIGGGGIVVQCVNKDQEAIRYALKIPRPSLFDGTEEKARAAYWDTRQEVVKHAPLSHENVARIFGWGKMDIPNRKGGEDVHRIFLMEWIDGATPLNIYLAGTGMDYRRVVDLVMQCFKALAYIHEKGLIHWDIKSDNLLVSARGTVKLTDIGNARSLGDTDRGLLAYSTRGNPPEKLVAGNAGGAGFTSRRIPITLPDKSWDCPWLDLWMLARELNRLFRGVPRLAEMDWKNAADGPEEAGARSGSFLKKFPRANDNARFALRFLRLIIRRLLYPDSPTRPTCYNGADSVVQDLAKLMPEFGGAQSVPELQAIPQSVLRLPESGNAPWTPRVGLLFNSAPLQRLRKHRQLGAVSRVYPGASHTRLEHIAGTMATVAQYVRALYSDRSNPFWRLQSNARDVEALLLAALLHDVGHLAFGHYLEEMEGLFRGRTHVDYAVLLLDPRRGTEGAASRQTSPVLFGRQSRKAAETDRELIRSAVRNNWGVQEEELDELLERAAEILRLKHSATAASQGAGCLAPRTSRELKQEVLHSIMDSAIDADKLDYLLRDAHHSGVHYAQGIDVDRFYQSLTAIPFFPRHDPQNADTLRASIAVTERGLLPVESILIARYQMFSCVYWHHTTRALTAMLQYLVLSYLALSGDSEAAVNRRLDELIARYRKLEDEEAIVWLKGQLLSDRTALPEVVDLRGDMADGVLGADRKLIYWSVFELQYRPGEAQKERKIFEGLREATKIPPEGSPAASVNHYRAVRAEFSKLLSEKLDKKVLFADGEVLIDIPPAGKDQVDNVFVVRQGGEQGAKQGKIYQIQELSPIANAVGDAFSYWVRKPRVFMNPKTSKRCRAAGFGDKNVWEACFSAVEDMVLRQPYLPLSRARSGRGSDSAS